MDSLRVGTALPKRYLKETLMLCVTIFCYIEIYCRALRKSNLFKNTSVTTSVFSIDYCLSDLQMTFLLYRNGEYHF